MLRARLRTFTERLSALQELGKGSARFLHETIMRGGEKSRRVADFFHGTWLGHPLHPMLTDVVIGSWFLAPLFDLLGIKSRTARQTADILTGVGTIAALPTALAGLTDFSTIPQEAAGLGLTHALCNDAATTAHLFSLRARLMGRRRQGYLLTALGLGLASLGAYLGGHLVYQKRVGVNRSAPRNAPLAWKPVLEVAALPADKPTRILVEGHPVLLYREAGRICAIAALCPHAGGPLDEGEIEEEHVTCPWHDSVFELCTGEVVHGPSPFPVPHYETRIHEGQIELRLPGGTA